MIQLIIIILTISIGSLEAIPSKKIKDHIGGLSWQLKWSKRIGLTTFRTSIQHVNNQIILGSNGKSYSQRIKDSLDGVYFIDAKTGEQQFHIRPSISGDNDVNGVATTAHRIFFGNDDHQLFAYSWNKTRLWELTLDADIEGVPALGDFNNDGIMDVCVGTESGQLLAINGENGDVIWQFQALLKPQWTYPKTRAFIASPTLIDIDRDGTRDVVIGNRNGDLYALNGQTGEELWSFRTGHPSGIHSSVFASQDTIYFTESYGILYAFSKQGRQKFKISIIPENIPHLKSSPVETPKGTIVIATSWDKESGVWVFPRLFKPVFIKLGKVSASPVVADFLGNGTVQVGILSEQGTFTLISEKGELVGQFKLPYGGEATPLITDTDGNGTLELIIATSDQYIACYEIGVKGSIYWSGFRGNPYNTGVVSDRLHEDFEETFKALQLPQQRSYDYRTLYQETFENTDYIIDEQGIGPVKLGITMEKLKILLGESIEYQDINLGIGLNAKAVIWNNKVQLYILFPSWQKLADNDVVSMLVTNHPQYQTAEGIRPNSTVQAAVNIYGPVQLMYQVENNLEERLHFKNKKSKVWFANYGKAKIGQYSDKKLFKVTTNYNPMATIGFIGVK